MQSGPCPPVRLGRVSALIGLSALIACSAVAEPAHQSRKQLSLVNTGYADDTAKSTQLPLWGGVSLHGLNMDSDMRAINVAVPLPAVPYMPKLSFHRHAYEAKGRFGDWQSGGARAIQAHLPFGLTFEAGHRIDPFGRQDDEFVGLTFTYSHLRHHHENWHHGRLGADRGAPIPDGLRKSNSGNRFWKIASSVALVAALAGGGGGGDGGIGSPEQEQNEPAADGWRLVWSDEFNGNQLDGQKWNKTDSWGRDQCFGGGNHEAQCYTEDAANISVNGGNLVLTALPQTGLHPERTYTSGRIQSAGKGDFKYGRFEARMKFPVASGAWPAFWMLPTAPTAYALGGQDWPRSGEIDIVENANGNPVVGGAIHFKDPANPALQAHTYRSGSSPSLAVDQWHEYRIDWHADRIRWYLDGEPYFTLEKTAWNYGNYSVNPQSENAPFDQNFHLILNLALSDNGDYTQAPIDHTAFENGQSMLVDWVKVYECADGPNSCQYDD